MRFHPSFSSFRGLDRVEVATASGIFLRGQGSVVWPRGHPDRWQGQPRSPSGPFSGSSVAMTHVQVLSPDQMPFPPNVHVLRVQRVEEDTHV